MSVNKSYKRARLPACRGGSVGIRAIPLYQLCRPGPGTNPEHSLSTRRDSFWSPQQQADDDTLVHARWQAWCCFIFLPRVSEASACQSLLHLSTPLQRCFQMHTANFSPYRSQRAVHKHDRANVFQKNDFMFSEGYHAASSHIQTWIASANFHAFQTEQEY